MDDPCLKTSVIITLSFAVIGLVKLIGSYIVSSKWICCGKGQVSLVDILKLCFQKKCQSKPTQTYDVNHSVNHDSSPLCSSAALVLTVKVIYVFSKFLIVGSNFTYLWFSYVHNETEIFSGCTETELYDAQRRGQSIASTITFFGCIAELSEVIVLPLTLLSHLILYEKICNCKHIKLKRSEFFRYLLYADLQIALTLAPFFNVYLHYLGGLNWIFIVIRLIYYCITFTAAIIIGIRFLLNAIFFTIADIACCHNGEEVEIKNWKHLIFEVGYQLFSITVNIFTSSSALATYFKIAVIQIDPVRYAYLAFTLLNCFNAMAATFYNAVLLRWVVMKEDKKIDDSIGSKTLKFLKYKAPSSHIAFVIGLIHHLGLIALNYYILNLGNLD